MNAVGKKKKKRKKVCAGSGSSRKLPGQTDRQTDRPVNLIYKIDLTSSVNAP